MDALPLLTLTLLIFLAALLYATVGQAGASGYLAAMALFGLLPGVMKPAALALNIVVASIATLKYYRAGRFSWPHFWPFALGSIPMAFIGGAVHLPGSAYKVVVGLVLFYAACRMFRTAQARSETAPRRLPIPWALAVGAAIGLLSGLTGVGGGIFLSPLLLFAGWADIRVVSGVTAMFILVNSTAGLLGNLSSIAALPGAIVLWAPAAAIGGWIGAEYGSRRFDNTAIRRMLSLVLVVAGVKMMLP